MQNVGFDEPRYDLDGGALGGYYHVDAAGTRQLRDTHDALFDAVFAGHHEVSHLVDYQHYLRHLRLRLFVAEVFVVFIDVPAADAFKDGIPSVHFLCQPLQRVDGVLCFLDGVFDKKVRKPLINTHLDTFGVYHDEAYVLGRIFIKNAYDDGVQEHRLSGTGGARHQ